MGSLALLKSRNNFAYNSITITLKELKISPIATFRKVFKFLESVVLTKACAYEAKCKQWRQQRSHLSEVILLTVNLNEIITKESDNR